MKKAVPLLSLLLLVALAEGASAGLTLEVRHTLRYTITVHWQGSYYPDRTTIRVELADIPLPTEHQTVTPILQDGRLENLNGRTVWVIEKYMREVPYTTITFTGTFEVTVDQGNLPPVPHAPLEPPGGMEEYLSPDEYVTLSPEVRELAARLAGETENDLPRLLARLVGWIQENLTYSKEVGEGVRLTDAQVLQVRAGVCDEFSTLFIGLCRSLGLPARYVSGYSSDNENLYRKLETGHAWAEVWVPGGGWLPVDPTWGDLGNAGRIATGGGASRYEWRGAPPGSGITGVEYEVVPIGWQPLRTLENPASLAKERGDNGWRITVHNSSPVPLLDNVAVRVREENEWRTLQGWWVLLNPGENFCFEVPREGLENGMVFSRLGGFLWLWELPPFELPSSERETWLGLAAVLLLLLVLLRWRRK